MWAYIKPNQLTQLFILLILHQKASDVPETKAEAEICLCEQHICKHTLGVICLPKK